jgi:hypothetical protein
MRIRILGQNLPISIAVLALAEALVAFVSVYAAVLIRFEVTPSHLPQLQQEIGVLWPRAA